jgi:hypothetical protein
MTMAKNGYLRRDFAPNQYGLQRKTYLESCPTGDVRRVHKEFHSPTVDGFVGDVPEINS